MKKIAFVLLTSLFITACNNNTSHSPANNEKKELVKISLRFDWITNMSFIGDIFAMQETAKKNNLELSCEQAGFGVDPVKMILTGKNDFGVVSFEQLLLANEKGANLVAIAVINDVSPTVFICKTDKKFSTPNDFVGNTIGINPGGATEYVYRTFLKVNNIDKNKLKEIPVDFDVKSFIANKYDVRLAFAYVEPLDLDNAGIKYSIIEPNKFGLKFPGRVYFTTKETIEKKPELVQAFINTIAEGWEKALSQSDKSFQYMKEFDSKIDEQRERKSFEIGKKYYTGYNNSVLSFDEANLVKTAQLLKTLGMIKNDVIDSQINTSFINKFHKK